MDINLLAEYIEFSKSMNINSASKSLFMSQSGLSKHLAAIEAEVGVTLIDRRNGLKLTEAGKTFLTASSKITHIYNQTLEKCVQLAKTPEKVTILKPCTIDASREMVFSVYRNMLQQHKEINVEIIPMGSFGAVENLIMRRVDCATLHSCNDAHTQELKDAGISLLPLFEDEVYAWIPESHPLAAKDGIYIDDLIDVPIYTPASRTYSDMQAWIDDLCSLRGFKPFLLYEDVGDMFDLMNANLEEGVMLLTSEAIMGDPVIEMQNHMVLRPLLDSDLHNTVFLGTLKSNTNPALLTLQENIIANRYPEIESKGVRDIIPR